MSQEQDRREQRGSDGHIWTRWSPVSEEAAHARQHAQDGNWEAAQTYALLAVGYALHRIDRRLDRINDNLELLVPAQHEARTPGGD
jgi:hypothetical protein